MPPTHSVGCVPDRAMERPALRVAADVTEGRGLYVASPIEPIQSIDDPFPGVVSTRDKSTYRMQTRDDQIAAVVSCECSS